MLIYLAAVVVIHNFLLLVLGFLTESLAAQGTLVVFAIICFFGGYFARTSRLVSRAAYWLGGILASLLLAQTLLLPLLTEALTTAASMFLAFFVYVFTRRPIHRRLLRRNAQGQRQAPPMGREWLRWVIAFLL